jgi:SAM-dependent methyltransferase
MLVLPSRPPSPSGPAPRPEDLARLDRLRELFLDERRGERPLADYWRDAKDLAAYDAVLAARIGWKWDAALREAVDRGFAMPGEHTTVLDFGCGSGIAAARVANLAPRARFLLHDRSPEAMRFAQQRLAKLGMQAARQPEVGELAPDLLLVSHVLGELDHDGTKHLESLLRRSRSALFVEPGNAVTARRLAHLRDAVLDAFVPVAPCPHAHACPTLAAPNEWCHFFAPPPPEVFTDGAWVITARELGIDLRSLPYSCLALVRRDVAAAEPSLAALPAPAHRLLSRPDVDKHDATLRACLQDGTLSQLRVTKRAQPDLFKALRKGKEPLRTLP